jgi:hypothetical protein
MGIESILRISSLWNVSQKTESVITVVYMRPNYIWWNYNIILLHGALPQNRQNVMKFWISKINENKDMRKQLFIKLKELSGIKI